MAEYIKREDVGLSDFEIVMCNGDYKEALKMLLEKVEKIPSADVVERKHGKWMDGKRLVYGPRYYYYRYCSECLCERDDDNPDKDTPYCPNCGADMRQEDGDG